MTSLYVRLPGATSDIETTCEIAPTVDSVLSVNGQPYRVAEVDRHSYQLDWNYGRTEYYVRVVPV
jgi:hypothetical protein